MRNDDQKINTDGYKAVIDSGTSILVGPQPLVKQLIEGIVVNPDCSNVKDLPEIAFEIEGVEYPLSPSDYVL